MAGLARPASFQLQKGGAKKSRSWLAGRQKKRTTWPRARCRCMRTCAAGKKRTKGQDFSQLTSPVPSSGSSCACRLPVPICAFPSACSNRASAGAAPARPCPAHAHAAGTRPRHAHATPPPPHILGPAPPLRPSAWFLASPGAVQLLGPLGVLVLHGLGPCWAPRPWPFVE